MKGFDLVTEMVKKRILELEEDLRNCSIVFTHHPQMCKNTFLRGTNEMLDLNCRIYLNRVGEPFHKVEAQ